MINISDKLQYLLNILEDNSKKIQKEFDKIKNEKSDEAELVKTILQEEKSKCNMIHDEIKKYSENHCNLVMLTDNELDRLCGGI